MSASPLGIDVYQITTLLCHAEEGRLANGGQQVAMAFFFRELPRGRNYVVAAGLRSVLAHCAGLRFDERELGTLLAHPLIGPPLRDRPAGRAVLEALRGLSGFVGEIDACPEGTLAFAGPAQRLDGAPVVVAGAPLIAYTPLIQVRTDLLTAKLIETPWLCRLNHQSMVASKAARVVSAAEIDGRRRPVIEFGQRRTHHEAAVDAAYAAYLAGCQATSNLLATHRFGIPSVGTMDHFAVQAAEREDMEVNESERGLFSAFHRLFPHASTLLVDTYDVWQGIRGAVESTGGRLKAVRIDSGVSPETVRRARSLLDSLGAPHAQIFVSDALDEWRVRELARAGADAFGVGENITCSPDSATGVGAVGKLVLNGYGKLTMKLSRGSGKATLPGLLEVHRYADHDLLCLEGEKAPPGGRALLQPVWRGARPLGELPSIEETRSRVRAQIAALPPHLRALETDHGRPWPIVISEGLYRVIEDLAGRALRCAGGANS